MRGGERLPGDDFYCWRYQVWYSTVDCATRTLFRTAPGCRDCAQGERNLALRRGRIPAVKWARLPAGFADSPDLDPAEKALPQAS